MYSRKTSQKWGVFFFIKHLLVSTLVTISKDYMALTPTKGRILIKKLEREDTATDSGVLLPGQMLQEESLLYGEIIKEHPDNSTQYGEGTKVFYSRYSSTLLRDETGKPVYVVSDLDVMAVEQ